VIAKKKLIEVALPLDAINKASAREKSIRHGHPSTFHLWWARRPLAAARAVIFAQLVDDPSANPDLFPTEQAQERERQRLFGIIEELVQWENTTNETVLRKAREEIWQSWRRACAENADHPRARDLFDRSVLPAFHDPFAGGGSLPLEAQRLGLHAYASDLNPVAVLINKAMIEIPPRFAGNPPVNPKARSEQRLMSQTWSGTQGLAADVRYYGEWMRDEAEKRIGHLYPRVLITAEIVKERPELAPSLGQELTVIAWLWARTVKSPNPAFRDVDVPLTSTFMLSTKSGKEAYVAPIVSDNGYKLKVRTGKPTDISAAQGTRLARGANFRCLMSDTPITSDYVQTEAQAGRLGVRLLAVVADSDKGRVYLSPDDASQTIAEQASPSWNPAVEFFQQALGFRIGNYGMKQWSDLFTPRQTVALATLAELCKEVVARIASDAEAADHKSRHEAEAYAAAICTYLSLGVSRQANRSSVLNFWDSAGENVQQVFARQALSMIWDFVEANPFSTSTGNFLGQLEYLTRVLESALPAAPAGRALQQDAQTQELSADKVVSTDPPYFDNVGYADLSDFFYVWLRYALQEMHPDLFATVATPKTEELVATPHRHGGKSKAEEFFLNGMTAAMVRLSSQTHPAFPVTIYYAFRQSETEVDGGTSSTGWDTFLESVVHAGFAVTGTWPVRTEYTGNLKTKRNALASSIVLVCRLRVATSAATRREFQDALREELPVALSRLQRSNIAPVDLAQASIGPGMAVFTRFREVLNADGSRMTVREALALINATLDEVLAEQEGDFDADTRWAVTWSEQFGYAEGEYGIAETLAKAKVTSVSGMQEAGILHSARGRVKLKEPKDLDAEWNPEKDSRLTVWEMTHQLIRALESGGERAAAVLVARLGSKAEAARELAYRLYVISERKKRATDALSYNGLVQSWPEIVRLARDETAGVGAQGALAFDRA